MRNEEYIKKWVEGTLGEEERKVFEQTDTYHSLKKLSESLQGFKAPEYHVQKEWDRLQLKRSDKGKVKILNWINPLLRLAAVFVILIGTYYFFFQNSTTTFQTKASENTELTLPDSSYVIMNAFSRLTFNKKKWDRYRKVKMDGEAFFKVVRGSKFDVETESGIISVLGTQFNVKNRKDYFEVICYEGLVQVKSKSEVVNLSPQQMFRFINGRISNLNNLTDKNPSWILDESSFQSVPFIQVIREFERQYDVKVITNNVDVHQLFTGRFVNSDISLALSSISLPLNLTYQMAGDHSIILEGDNK